MWGHDFMASPELRRNLCPTANTLQGRGKGGKLREQWRSDYQKSLFPLLRVNLPFQGIPWEEKGIAELLWKVLTRSQPSNQEIVNHSKGIKDFYFDFFASTGWESRGWSPSPAAQERGKAVLLYQEQMRRHLGGIEAL